MPPKVQEKQPLSKAAMLGHGALVVARRSFDYTDDLGVDRGQIFRLRNCRNDEKMLRLGYVSETNDENGHTCGKCGAVFTGLLELNGHGKLRHPESGRGFRNPNEEDNDAERRERMENEISPLYLDKTVASQKGA